MTRRERIERALYQAVDHLNTKLKGKHVDKSLDAPLYEKNGNLDSLDFASFIMDVEDEINKEFGADITIAEDDLFAGKDSPFATIGGVIAYLERVLEEPADIRQH